MEGCSQRKKDYITLDSELNSNQLTSARLANKSMLLLAFNLEVANTLPQRCPGLQSPLLHQQINASRHFPTMLTFISSALISGNYDNYVNLEEERIFEESNVFEGTSFTQNDRIPMLYGLARKVAAKEEK